MFRVVGLMNLILSLSTPSIFQRENTTYTISFEKKGRGRGRDEQGWGLCSDICNAYVYSLCELVCIGIHESDAELTCMCFFSGVLTYCVMLQAFKCYCSYVKCL